MFFKKTNFFFLILFLFSSSFIKIDNINAMNKIKEFFGEFKTSANSINDDAEQRKKVILNTLNNLITRFDDQNRILGEKEKTTSVQDFDKKFKKVSDDLSINSHLFSKLKLKLTGDSEFEKNVIEKLKLLKQKFENHMMSTNCGKSLVNETQWGNVNGFLDDYFENNREYQKKWFRVVTSPKVLGGWFLDKGKNATRFLWGSKIGRITLVLAALTLYNNTPGVKAAVEPLLNCVLKIIGFSGGELVSWSEQYWKGWLSWFTGPNVPTWLIVLLLWYLV